MTNHSPSSIVVRLAIFCLSIGASACRAFAPSFAPVDARPAPRTIADGSRSGRIIRRSNVRRCASLFSAIAKIEGYDDAFRVIDECASSGRPTDGLYDAVRFIDRNAIKIYPTLEAKEDLWDEAHGSWKLVLATGGGKYTTFKTVPVFAFAVIDEDNFGNGVGFNEEGIVLSLLGPHIFNPKRRQMTITIDDAYLFGSRVTNYVPGWIKDGMGLGKPPEEFKTRPPAFTFIGASEHALIARGGTGGIAIWSRLVRDIRPAAYGKSEST